MTAFVIATIAVTTFLVSPRESPLPALGWAAGFLFFIVEEDLRHRRIPNWLTAPGFVMALALSAFSGGWTGLAHAALGTLTAVLLLIAPFAMRQLGAGDVKAVMVLGALWGPGAILGSLAWMIVAGGALALTILAARGGLIDLLERWGASFLTWRATRRWVPLGPTRGGGEHGLPFALAIALGASAYQFWGSPWL